MKAPEGRLMINTTGNAAMAKAGSGDVLAGMITGLMAQHMRPDDAAVLGVLSAWSVRRSCQKRTWLLQCACG